MDDERLLKAREVIAEADRDMARCFVKRMEAVREIAACKRERGLPILDEAQERRVIERNLAWIEPEELRGHYVNFLRGLMDVAKDYQRELLDGCLPEAGER